MSQPPRRSALGKGLSALIPDLPEIRTRETEVDIDLLSANRLQPRSAFPEASLDDLAQSIKASGIIQPIVVQRNGERFQIIAGERRWRAAQRAGLLRVPVVVREAATTDRSLLEMALIENLQREDLNPIDEALAYRRLADEFELTQEAIATAVGKDRATVANVLRLLRLPEDVRSAVASGTLSMGHARSILAIADAADQRRIARDVVARGLSVRETEALVKKATGGGRPSAGAAPGETPDVHTRAAEDRLRLALGTRVRIVRRGTRGRIEIDFGSEVELIRLFDQLTEKR